MEKNHPGKKFQEHWDLLKDLGHGISTDATMRQVEEFICKMYCPGTHETSVNNLRFKLLQKGTVERENLPPTQKFLQ